MGLLDNLKDRMKKVSDKIPEITDEAIGKIKKTGEDGVELTKEIMGDISDKFNDITALTRLKHEIKNLKIELDDQYLELGKIAYAISKNKMEKSDFSQVEGELNHISELQSAINDKTAEYERLQKERSDSYIVQKMSDELSEAGAIIDQVIVSEKSNMAGKSLKETTLPREALITVVKRNEEVIIPEGNTQILAGDLVTVSGIEGDVRKVIKRLSGSK